MGLDIVDLDEARRRLVEKDFNRRFVCFTLDDGYEDNYSIAYPIFVKHNVPFAVYVTTGIADGTAILWWIHLEDIIREEQEIDIVLGGRRFSFPLATEAEKYIAFSAIYWHMRGLPQADQQEAIALLVNTFELDPAGLCKQCGMSWQTLAKLSEDDLVTIGAHTVNHFALSKLTSEELIKEVTRGRDILEDRLGKKLRHFTYPFGDAGSAASRDFDLLSKLGFATSTTTRKGMLFPAHADHLQALPRVSLNGDYQQDRYVRLFLSGAPFALWNGFRKLDVT
jgi:peptidoglycan/xylan/chitin deacetylase (PgdA/CDA1 family)